MSTPFFIKVLYIAVCWCRSSRGGHSAMLDLLAIVHISAVIFLSLLHVIFFDLPCVLQFRLNGLLHTSGQVLIFVSHNLR